LAAQTLVLLDGTDVSLMVDLKLCFVFKALTRSLCVLLQFYECCGERHVRSKFMKRGIGACCYVLPVCGRPLSYLPILHTCASPILRCFLLKMTHVPSPLECLLAFCLQLVQKVCESFVQKTDMIPLGLMGLIKYPQQVINIILIQREGHKMSA
jgi:hypothetical protein